jgi:hypothetical protein
MNKEKLLDIPFVKISGKVFTFNEIEEVLAAYSGYWRRSKARNQFVSDNDVNIGTLRTSLVRLKSDLQKHDKYKVIAKRLLSAHCPVRPCDYSLDKSALAHFIKTGEFETYEKPKLKPAAHPILLASWV